MATKEKKPKKVRKPPEPHWNDLVDVYFNFCGIHFKEEPVFDGSAPRDLKSIVKSLRERTESIPLEWTLDLAKLRLYSFFKFAHDNSEWLRKNWLLSNLNRQKQSIFFSIRAAIEKQPQHPFE